jgi:hypothetical protein
MDLGWKQIESNGCLKKDTKNLWNSGKIKVSMKKRSRFSWINISPSVGSGWKRPWNVEEEWIKYSIKKDINEEDMEELNK